MFEYILESQVDQEYQIEQMLQWGKQGCTVAAIPIADTALKPGFPIEREPDQGSIVMMG